MIVVDIGKRFVDRECADDLLRDILAAGIFDLLAIHMDGISPIGQGIPYAAGRSDFVGSAAVWPVAGQAGYKAGILRIAGGVGDGDVVGIKG